MLFVFSQLVVGSNPYNTRVHEFPTSPKKTKKALHLIDLNPTGTLKPGILGYKIFSWVA